MSRIPRGIGATVPIRMAYDGSVVGIIRSPIATSCIDDAWNGKCASVRIGARENIMRVTRSIGASSNGVHRLALFRQCRVRFDVIAVSFDIAVQVLNTGGDQYAFLVVPRSRSDAVASIDAGHSGIDAVAVERKRLSAEIGMPSMIARTDRCGEILTDSISTPKPSQIACPGWSRARDEECHRMLGRGSRSLAVRKCRNLHRNDRNNQKLSEPKGNHGLHHLHSLLLNACILQDINVLPGSFMTGQIRWAIIGGIAVSAGIALLVVANPRRLDGRR